MSENANWQLVDSQRAYGYRVDRVDVHDALEEALANALAHA